MNILFLNSLKKSKWGGGEKWMVNAGEGLESRGHKVIIACQPNSAIERKSKEMGLKTWPFSIPADIAFWKIPSLKLFLLNRNIDVLICCQNKDVKIGAKAAREVGIKGIFARQGIQNLSNKRKYIRPFTEYIDGIITNTNSIKKNYESFGWFPQDFIHVVYNGVSVPETVEEFDLHERYALPGGSRVITTAGRLDHQKGFDLLIKVAQMAREKERDWQFIIAGQGKLKNALNALADKLGVKEMVHLIGFSQEVYSIIKSSDIFVLPSRYEGMPNALLEAMALGKANVATSVNGAPELVIDGVTGFLVEPEDTQRMFEKMDLILNNDTLRNSMGHKSQERVEKYFTNEKMVEHLERIFLDRLGRKR